MKHELVAIDRKIEALARSVDERFAQMDERFARVDERFARVDERFAQVDARFVQVLQEIAAEGARTRHHFDVVAEQMKGERNVAIDKCLAVDARLNGLIAVNAKDHVAYEHRLDDHERRLRELEPE